MTLLNRLHEKLRGSQQLFEALDDQGVDHNATHTIEHHFMSADQSSLVRLGETACFLGFGFGDVSELKDPSGITYFHADVFSRVPMLSEDYFVFVPAAREAVMMILLGDAHGVSYDGWGTMPIKK